MDLEARGVRVGRNECVFACVVHVCTCELRACGARSSV